MAKGLLLRMYECKLGQQALDEKEGNVRSTSGTCSSSAFSFSITGSTPKKGSVAHPGTVSHAPALEPQGRLMSDVRPSRQHARPAGQNRNAPTSKSQENQSTVSSPCNTMAFGCKFGAEVCQETKYRECMV